MRIYSVNEEIDIPYELSVLKIIENGGGKTVSLVAEVIGKQGHYTLGVYSKENAEKVMDEISTAFAERKTVYVCPRNSKM